MASVFISFIHEDEEIANAIRRLIEDELAPDDAVFLSSDSLQVLAGSLWIDKIQAAIESCEVLLSLLSARSARRPWINFEAGAAWIQKRPVIPVCLGKMSKASLPQPYLGKQALVLPGQTNELLKAVAEYLGKYYSPPIQLSNLKGPAKFPGQLGKMRSPWFEVLAELVNEYRDA
jgi:hypothetical protein